MMNLNLHMASHDTFASWRRVEVDPDCMHWFFGVSSACMAAYAEHAVEHTRVSSVGDGSNKQRGPFENMTPGLGTTSISCEIL